MSVIDERGIPANVDAEKFVLGSILLDGTRWSAFAGILDASDFALEKHRRIFRTFDAIDKSGRAIDRVTVANELILRNELESVDGLSYLVSLDDGLPHISNLDSYVGILQDCRMRRELIQAASWITDMASSGSMKGGEASEAAQEAIRGATQKSNIDTFPSLAKVISSHGGINGWMAERAVLGMRTGYQSLDEETGGLMPTDLWVIAGPTGGGKSTFTRNLAYQLAHKGYPGAIISLEMGDAEVTDGLIALHSGLSIKDLKRGIIRDREAFRDAMVMLNDLPVHVECQAITVPAIRSGLLRLKNQTGCRWAIVDFLQLMQATGRHGNREQEVASFAYGLKRTAIELDMGIIALSQLSRDQAKMKRKPELTDLRESGSIEFSANLVGFVWSEFQEVPMVEYPAEFLIRKQRSGNGNVDLGFNWIKRSGKFIDTGAVANPE